MKGKIRVVMILVKLKQSRIYRNSFDIFSIGSSGKDWISELFPVP